MKNLTHKKTLIALALVAAAALSPLPAQSQVGQPDPPPPRPAEGPGQGPAPANVRQVGFAIEGTVKQYLMNPHGEVDGLLLNDGAQVDFPPHMADELVAVIKPGDPIIVQGDRRENGAVIKADVMTNTRTSQSVIEHEPSFSDRLIPPHMKRLSMSEMKASGTIQALLYAPRGEVHGVVLEDGSQVRVPPHIGDQLAASLTVGRALNVEGNGTENQYGRAIEASSIGFAGEPMKALLRPTGQRGNPGGPPPVRP